MVDKLTLSSGPSVEPDPLEQSVPGRTSGAGLAQTTKGRLALGGAGLIVLAVLATILALFILPKQAADTATMVSSAGAASTGSSTPASDEETEVAPETVPLSSTFAFRDVFVPTVKPVSPAGTTSTTTTAGAQGSTTSTTSADGDTTTVPQDTLYLKSVSTEDGEAVATFIWNGTTYELSEGDQLGDTPWEVLEISGNTVVMLYGDSRVTLTVGQGISK